MVRLYVFVTMVKEKNVGNFERKGKRKKREGRIYMLCVCVCCVFKFSERLEESVRFSGAGVTNNSHPTWCWKQNLSSPQEQSVLLTHEPSLPPQSPCFNTGLFRDLTRKVLKPPPTESGEARQPRRVGKLGVRICQMGPTDSSKWI